MYCLSQERHVLDHSSRGCIERCNEDSLPPRSRDLFFLNANRFPTGLTSLLKLCISGVDSLCGPNKRLGKLMQLLARPPPTRPPMRVDSPHLPLLLTVHPLIIKHQILLIQYLRIILLPLLLLLVHLPIRGPAEHHERHDNQTPATDGCYTQGFARDHPVRYRNEENRKQRSDG